MNPLPSPGSLYDAFERPEPLTIGLEEELMLLDPETYELTPRAGEVLELAGSEERFKRELPEAQLEIWTRPHASVGAAIAELREGREALARATAGTVALAAAGVHPTADPEGSLSAGERYEHTTREYGAIARRQLVFALQIHVAVGGAERSLAVYNALRSYLPEIAALAANSPFHHGRDTGLASVRPKISEQLPRQGVPPALASWDEYARALAWGRRAGAFEGPSAWWWELRPHPKFGTLELRVPDAQTTLAEATGVAAFAHCLAAWLAARHDAGEPARAHADWVIAENRWWAARDGVEGALADLDTGERTPTRERLEVMLEELAPVAAELDCEAELDAARALVAENGALRQREVAAESGIEALPAWLAGRWLD